MGLGEASKRGKGASVGRFVAKRRRLYRKLCLKGKYLLMVWHGRMEGAPYFPEGNRRPGGAYPPWADSAAPGKGTWRNGGGNWVKKRRPWAAVDGWGEGQTIWPPGAATAGPLATGRAGA